MSTGKRRYGATWTVAPHHHSSTTAVQQQWSSTYRPIHSGCESTGTYTATETQTVQEYDEESFCCKTQCQLLLTEKEEGVARRRGGLPPELGTTKSTTRTRYDKNAGTCLRERNGTERLGRWHPTTTAVQQQYNISGAARTEQSITAAYSSNTAVQRGHLWSCGTPGAGWGFFLTFRGRSRAVPGRGFSCPALGELGLVGGCIAADTEGFCVGRAWHGRAVARGRVASGRAESCKCTGLRVRVISPLAPQRSEIIFLTHISVLELTTSEPLIGTVRIMGVKIVHLR